MHAWRTRAKKNMNVKLYWRESFTAPGETPIWEIRFSGRFPENVSPEEIFCLMDKKIPGLVPEDGLPQGKDLLEFSDENGKTFFERNEDGTEGWTQLAQVSGPAEVYPGPAGCMMVVLLPGEKPYCTRIEEDLKTLQTAVGGFIEITYPFEDNCFVVGNEEAKLIGMEGNRHISGQVYAGPLLIAGDDLMGGFCDLSPDQADMYMKKYAEPETISEECVQDSIDFKFFVS